MAQVAKVLFQGLLTNAVATLYAVPANKSTALTSVLFVNVDTVGRSYTFYATAPTLGATIPSLLANAVSIAANTAPVVFPAGGMLLTQGYLLQALASANNAIACFVCGIEYDP